WGDAPDPHGTLTITNSIIWGHIYDGITAQWREDQITITYSNIEGGWEAGGEGNINANPLFANPGEGDFRMLSSSPSIDAGNNDAIQEPLDLNGEERIQDDNNDGNPVVDMGVYEGGIPTPRYFVNHLAVDPGEDDPDRGKEWGKAFQSLETAIEVATEEALSSYVVAEIWVVAGTYSSNFNIESGLQIYGGFVGIEESLEERNWVDNKTTLTVVEGSVVTFSDVSELTLLDGFTITGGNEDTGGGIKVEGVPARNRIGPKIANSKITANSATTGGGIYISEASPQIINCAITGNIASSHGGGIYISSGNSNVSPTVINCMITGNTAESQGGGVFSDKPTPTFTNCTISGNEANQGDGDYFGTYGS
ncbi:uncharacterized protein METZ01_LOCUS315415, partial [marine metagenome]